jgi:hypothetical protein
MEKRDLRRELKELFAPSSRDFAVVDVPPLPSLMVDGEGDPNTAPAYRDAVEALYSTSCALTFSSKKGLEKDHVAGPLEGLSWAADTSACRYRAKSEWRWTMTIIQPHWITAEMVSQALHAIAATKQLPALALLRVETYHEGRAAQILHVGSYDDECPTLDRLHRECMPAHGLDFDGPAHELSLSDPRKTIPAEPRTLLRQPVREHR